MNIQDRNEPRFLELIADNRARILKICRVYTRTREDQDDLYQEILCQIWRALPQLREQAHANTWLYRVGLNTAISFVRKHNARRSTLGSDDDSAIEEVPDTRAARDLESEEKRSQLFQAISQLNEMEKAVITLFLENLSYEEIASVIGLSPSNVGVMLHRVKKKLSTLMKDVPCKTTL